MKNSLALLLLFISLSTYSQDTLQTILRGCLTDVYRLDSSEAQHEVKDSLILLLYDLNEDYRYQNYLYDSALWARDRIIENHEAIEQTYVEEVKLEKKKKRSWQLVSGGLGVVLILLLI